MDSLIPMNFRLHNTLWVPGHFHSYMLMGAILWILALITYLAERAANQPSSRFTNIAAPTLIFGGGTFFVGMWYFSGASGVPRRMAEHFGGIETADTIAAIAAITLLIGVVLVFIEWIRLWGIARARKAAGEVNEPEAVALTPTPGELAPPTPMIQTRGELMATVAALTFSLVSFLPFLDPIVEEKIQWHHVQHGGQILFGLLLAIAIVNTPTFAKLRCRNQTVGIAAIVLGTAVMYALMIPSWYDTLENNQALHMLFHLGVMVVGLVIGWAITSFDRFTAWLLFLMMASMGFAYGIGVGLVV